MSDYREINRQAWAHLARAGCDSSLPYGPAEFAEARRWLDTQRWIPWRQVNSVLCLACGGGQQAPLFASLGCQVTLADISPDQLEIDRDVAARNGFEIECIEADMLDLAPLHGREFDLVYQAVSACYVPDVRPLYREVFSVLRGGGFYRAQHWNPVHLQLANANSWDGHAYRIAKPQIPGTPLPWVERNGHAGETATCWHYLHPLGDLIGGVCDAGFTILRFEESCESDPSAEPETYLHLAAYLPSFFTFLARRRSNG